MSRSSSHPKLRLVLVGWGAIVQRVTSLLAEDDELIEICAIGVRKRTAQDVDLPAGALMIDMPEALSDIKPDLVVEAASRDAVEPWGHAAMKAGADFMPVSTSAFTDEALLARLGEIAKTTGTQVIVPSGAIGGIEVLSAATILPLQSVVHRIIKPPQAWLGTEAETLLDLAAITAPTVFFEGSAREVADRFPKNANATVITSLAGIGINDTRVILVADPDATLNAHVIAAEGDFGRFEIRLENRPLATNPKSSELTALSLVRMIRNQTSAIVV